MIGPRTPMQRPNTGTKRASRTAEAFAVSASSSSMPVAVPQKLAVTVWR